MQRTRITVSWDQGFVSIHCLSEFQNREDSSHKRCAVEYRPDIIWAVCRPKQKVKASSHEARKTCKPNHGRLTVEPDRSNRSSTALPSALIFAGKSLSSSPTVRPLSACWLVVYLPWLSAVQGVDPFAIAIYITNDRDRPLSSSPLVTTVTSMDEDSTLSTYRWPDPRLRFRISRS